MRRAAIVAVAMLLALAAAVFALNLRDESPLVPDAQGLGGLTRPR